jgi:hypothetical protein
MVIDILQDRSLLFFAPYSKASILLPSIEVPTVLEASSERECLGMPFSVWFVDYVTNGDLSLLGLGVSDSCLCISK